MPSPVFLKNTVPPASVPQSATATPTGPTLLPRLVIVQPTPGATPHPTPPATPRLGPHTVDDSEHMSTDHDLGGLLTPSESSFSGITDTSLSTVDTMDDAVASVNPSPSFSAAVAEFGAEPLEAPAAFIGESAVLPRGHARKSSKSSAPGGERTVQNRTGNAATSKTRGATRSGATGRLERTKSQGSSRSRSPGRGVGLGGLMMTMTTVVVADSGEHPMGGGHVAEKPKKAGGATRVVGKRPGMGRTLSAGRVVSVGHAGNAGKGKEKRPAFNIGSNSDEGGGSRSHSKSVGSGSDGGKAVGRTPANLMPGVPHTRHGPSASLSAVHVPPPDPPVAQPQLSQSRKMVLVTDDSEGYETETDSDGVSQRESRGRDPALDKGKSTGVVDQGDKPGAGGGSGEDDGEWASEETGDEDERPAVHKVAGQKQGVSGGSGGRVKYQAQVQQQRHHQHHQHHQRPAAHLANPQEQHPGRHAKRLQAEAQARLAKHTVEHAALEAERLRDMFVRKPVPSSEQLAAMRSKSVGLLTQLLNPDPRIFPVGHPYRRGFSSGEIAVGGGQGGVGGGTGSGPVVGNASEAGEDSRSRIDVSVRRRHGDGQGRMPRGLPPMAGVGAPGLKLTKSAAALPVASVGSVIAVQATKSDSGGRTSPKASGSGRDATGDVRSPDSGRWSNGMSGGYRPRGRPADQELDTESESEEEGGKGKKNSILLSKSVAQEKLKALAMKRGIKPSTGTHGDRNRDSGRQQEQEELEPVPEWARSETAVGNGSRQRSSSRLQSQDSHPIQQQQQTTVSRQVPGPPPPVPIPVGHPYNLPLPAPPSTPRTTRRLMLQTEMSESLRRNLLWERQVSKNTMAGFRRTNSSGDASGSGSGRRGNVLGGGLQPFTGLLPPVVQLTPKKGKGVENGNEAEERKEEPRKPLDRAELEKRALARTKTWANDFHFVGW